jgi:acetyltransferase-like isoleucine patch superfamily enzyme
MKLLFYKVLYGRRFAFGRNLSFYRNFYISLEDKGKLKIGKYCFFNNDCSINCLGNVTIGDGCLFGENVKLYDCNHIYKEKTKPIVEQGFNIGEIKIGNNCWIGSNVVILKNVIIGNNVVVGANCTIYKSIPSNTIIKSKEEYIENRY